ncbi:ATP synthase regulation protein NCA2 [Aspergillus luchuensis]|uniref:ATP synthase regulation protein NCA2 n=1 Tax=Aspergillus kawachii TaxID=1069201 RepID=A0A146G035_ASPKA|nr:ATP synthase regulation protein NCA2 [Aspergillus luchuensis]
MGGQAVEFVGSPKPEMGHLWRGRQLAVMNKAWLDSDFELCKVRKIPYLSARRDAEDMVFCGNKIE